MSRKRSSSKKAPSKQTAEPQAASHSPANATPSQARPPWQPVVLIALFLTRYFLPAESAAAGETSLLAAAWILVTTVVVFFDWREDRVWQFDRRDVAIWVFVTPVILAGLWSSWWPLNVRGLLNVTWEWISLGVSLTVLKQCLDGASRRVLTASLVAVLSGVAVYGLYQHFVWYPSMSATLLEYEQLERRGDLSSAETARLRELSRFLGPQVLSGDETSRNMLRDRLVNSTEPLGFFALANTLAGMLGVAILWVACARKPTSWQEWIVRGGCLGVLGLAFLLTKSRTAVLALAAAGVAIGFVQLGRRGLPWRPILLGGLGVVGVVGVLCTTGSLDVEVLTESNKSLQYRVEYWTATSRLLASDWLTGVGVGNFRPAYLSEKLAGSSEEILDPHNWILEAWTTAGLLGLLMTLGAVAWSLWKTLTRSIEVTAEQQPEVGGRVFPTLAVATLVALIWNGFPIAFEMPILVAGVIAVFIGVFGQWVWTEQQARTAGLGAGVFLTVHLLASGGYGMPAVTQTWLASMLVLSGTWSPETSPRWAWPPGRLRMTSLGLAIVLLLGLFLVVRPNMGRDRWMAEADVRLMFERNANGALVATQRAIAADPFDPGPWQQAALIRQARGEHDAAFAAIAEAVSRSPAPTLAQWAGQLAEKMDAHDVARSYFSEAAAGYPNGSDVRADYAESLAGVNPAQAAEEARVALRLDDLNRDAGHTDKVFSDDRRLRLQTIARHE